MALQDNREGMRFAGVHGEGCFRLSISQNTIKSYGFYKCVGCPYEKHCPCENIKERS